MVPVRVEVDLPVAEQDADVGSAHTVVVLLIPLHQEVNVTSVYLSLVSNCLLRRLGSRGRFQI